MINVIPEQIEELDDNVVSFPEKEHEDKRNYVVYYDDLLEEMVAKGYDKDYVKKVMMYDLKTGPENRYTYNEVVSAVHDRLEADEKEKVTLEKMAKMQEESAKKSVASADYRNQINNALKAKHCYIVHYKEVADTLYNNLTKEEQDDYMNKPLYACYEMLNTPQFDAAVSQCVERFHRSASIDAVIQKYIEDNYDHMSPEYYEHTLASIAAACPSHIYRGDDVRLMAYHAICAMSDNKKDVDDITAEDIRKIQEIQEEVAAKFASEVSEAEPINVAAQRILDKDLMDKIQSKLGKTLKAGYNAAADAIIEGIGLDPRVPMDDDMEKMMQENPQVAALYKEELKRRKLENQELKAKIKNMKQGNYVPNNQYTRGYSAINNLRQTAANTKEDTDNLPLRIAAVATAVSYLLGLVTSVGTGPSTFAFIVCTVGALMKNKPITYISGALGILFILFILL